MSWKKALEKANKEFDKRQNSWSAPPTETKKSTAPASGRPERRRRSRSPGHGGLRERRRDCDRRAGDRRDHRRAELRSVERTSTKREARRGRSRSRGSPKRKGITKGEEDLILAQAFAIQKERREKLEKDRQRRSSSVLPAGVPKPKAAPPPKTVKATAGTGKRTGVAVEDSESYDYSESDTEDHAAGKLPAAPKAAAAKLAAKAEAVSTTKTASKSLSSKGEPGRADLVAGSWSRKRLSCATGLESSCRAFPESGHVGCLQTWLRPAAKLPACFVFTV